MGSAAFNPSTEGVVFFFFRMKLLEGFHCFFSKLTLLVHEEVVHLCCEHFLDLRCWPPSFVFAMLTVLSFLFIFYLFSAFFALCNFIYLTSSLIAVFPLFPIFYVLRTLSSYLLFLQRHSFCFLRFTFIVSLLRVLV